MFGIACITAIEITSITQGLNGTWLGICVGGIGVIIGYGVKVVKNRLDCKLEKARLGGDQH